MGLGSGFSWHLKSEQNVHLTMYSINILRCQQGGSLTANIKKQSKCFYWHIIGTNGTNGWSFTTSMLYVIFSG